MDIYIKHINSFKIKSSDINTYDNNSLKRISNIGRINLFIGKNNSGKSRLLRHIYSNICKANITLSRLEEMLKFLVDNPNEGAKKLKESVATFGTFNVGSIEHIISINSENILSINIKNDTLIKTLKKEITEKALKDPDKFANNFIDKFLNEEKENTPFVCFIPIQRSLRNPINFKNSIFLSKQTKYLNIPFSTLKDAYLKKISNIDFDYDDIYKHKVIDEYFANDASYGRIDYKATQGDENLLFSNQSKGNRSNNIVTGLNFYEDFKNMLLGFEGDRNIIYQYESFLKDKFFFNTVKIVPNEKEKKLYIQIGEEDEREISMIGDGLQQIIVITFPLYLRKYTKQYVFIEEPELHMHPSLQVQLINALYDCEEFQNMIFFLTTHSNHFLDIVLRKDEVSLFRVSKSNLDIELVRTNNLYDVIEDIGVKSSSLALTECTIWVEGVTDGIIIEKLIKIKSDHISRNYPIKGTDYDFIGYSGNNLSNWIFENSEEVANSFQALSVTNKFIVIADKDYNKEKKHEKYRESLGENYFCLDCLEIENLIHPKLLKTMVKEYQKDIDTEVEKWIFDENDYKNEKLGKFLEESLNHIGVQNINSYKSDSGSLTNYYKWKFAKRFVEENISWEEITESAKKLADRVYNFIISSSK